MYNILVTGASGFLGKYLIRSLNDFNIYTLGRNNSDIICDLSNDVPIIPNVDFVVHCSGKAHSIPKNEKEIKEFYDVNIKGTGNLLEGINKSESKLKGFIFISSVAVYGIASGHDISIDYPLLASDPYGISKIEAEKIIQSWGNDNKINITILRLPLIIGEPPVGNLKKIIDSIKKGYYIRVGKGNAKRSMVLAEDVAQFIPKILNCNGVFNLTDGYHPSIAEIDQKISSKLNIKRKIRILPTELAILLARIGDFIEFLLKRPILFNSNKLDKLTSSLTFSDQLARDKLGWKPRNVLDNI